MIETLIVFNSVDWKYPMTMTTPDEIKATIPAGKRQLNFGDYLILDSNVYVVTHVKNLIDANFADDGSEYTLKQNPKLIWCDGVFGTLSNSPEHNGVIAKSTMEFILNQSVIAQAYGWETIHVNKLQKYSGVIKTALRRFLEESLDGTYLHFDDLTLKLKL